MKIDAILWDYDGTLVNSVLKNIEITKQILSVTAPRLTKENLPDYLKDEESYRIANHKAKNWKDLYINYYGMSESEMVEAGTLWTEYQVKNTTPVELFPKIKQTVNQIKLPQGICSQNSSKNIKWVLKKNNLIHKFHSIIGYDDIPIEAQKPFPFAGLKCLEQMFRSISNRAILFIGDHEGDVEFARNIDEKLSGNSKVISIVVKYSGANTSSWFHKPDFEIENPMDIFEIVENFH